MTMNNRELANVKDLEFTIKNLELQLENCMLIRAKLEHELNDKNIELKVNDDKYMKLVELSIKGVQQRIDAGYYDNVAEKVRKECEERRMANGKD